MLGTEKIKSTLKNVITIGEDVFEALEDGFQAQDGFVLFKNIGAIQSLVADAPEAFAELKDLDPMEATEVTEFIAAEFDIDNDSVEE